MALWFTAPIGMLMSNTQPSGDSRIMWREGCSQASSMNAWSNRYKRTGEGGKLWNLDRPGGKRGDLETVGADHPHGDQVGKKQLQAVEGGLTGLLGCLAAILRLIAFWFDPWFDPCWFDLGGRCVHFRSLHLYPIRFNQAE